MRQIALRPSEAALWVGFFGLILLAWLVLFAVQPNAISWGGLPGFWAALCAPISANTSYLSVASMWALMSAAMMAPTFVPTLKTYRDLGHTGAATGSGAVALLGGYLAIWLGFSLIAAAAQLALARLELLGADGTSASFWFSAALLAGAGAYQFTPLKDACLSKCRAPLTYFIGHWRDGSLGAARMGVHLGAVCLGCCWALMALGFIGGVMNPVWMGVATLLMVAEKLPEIGRYVTRPLGMLLLAGAVFTGLLASGI